MAAVPVLAGHQPRRRVAVEAPGLPALAAPTEEAPADGEISFGPIGGDAEDAAEQAAEDAEDYREAAE